jgi:poly(3-hydroxybutyrate) depolymerase
VALALALALAGGCTDETPGGGQDGGAGDALAPDSGPRPTAPRTDPTLVSVSEWMLATSSSSPDAVTTALRDGTFAYPKPGYDANNMHWSAHKPGKNGTLLKFPTRYGWAVARVTLKAPARLFVRAGPSYGVWINGVERPADVYGSRRIWVPLPAKAGENLVVVRARGGSGTLQIELWTTPDELVMNEKDLTVPDPLVGDTAELCLGVPVLNLTGDPAYDLVARVVGDDNFEATAVTLPALGPQAVTHVSFKLKPKKAPATAGAELSVKLRLESSSLKFSYERELKLTTVGADKAYRRTRVSRLDGSCQFMGVQPPSKLDRAKKYALILSLHGAGVNALSQAKSYSQKDWAYVVAATNRRRFGFDWEVWGRLDAIEALDYAQQTFNIDPTRVYLTGHSMGGHGTWHVGVMHPGRFAVIGPSAGWSSFYSYGGSNRPGGAFARSQAHSDTNNFLSNLARRGVYIIHGSADTNVPVTEGRNMYTEVKKYATDVKYHEQPGAGHWWNGSQSTGTDCVDWPEMMDFMKARTLDPTELDFTFTTPAPWVSPTHSYVSIRSQSDPYKNSVLTSNKSGTAVALTTSNVRSMTLDGAALKKAGVTQLSVDGKAVTLGDGAIAWGAQSGKKPGVHGPFNEVMYRPFCFVYPDSGGEDYKQYAAFLISNWAAIGNGLACAMPLSGLKRAGAPTDRNLIFLGLASAEIDGATPPFSWDGTSIKIGSASRLGLLFVAFPRAGRLAAAVFATRGNEKLLFNIMPFTSRLVIPDYWVYGSTGTQTAGFFDASWKYDASLQR